MADTVIKKQALYVFLSIPHFQSWPKCVGMVEIVFNEFITSTTNDQMRMNKCKYKLGQSCAKLGLSWAIQLGWMSPLSLANKSG